MIAHVLQSFRAQLLDLFTYEAGQEAADALGAATRWGWLPALSGVAVGGEHARRSHAESMTGSGEKSA